MTFKQSLTAAVDKAKQDAADQRALAQQRLVVRAQRVLQREAERGSTMADIDVSEETPEAISYLMCWIKAEGLQGKIISTVTTVRVEGW